MKATELMIGDWILYGDKPVKVLQLSEKSEYDWVKLIPITPEILEKNGWEWASHRNDKVGTMDDLFFSGVGHTYFFSDGRTEVDIIGYGIGHSGRGAYRGVIDYVHELQHILRMVGLDDMADNFKIE